VLPNSGELKLCEDVRQVVTPELNKRKSPLTLRVSEFERNFIKFKAEQAGLSTNAYIKAAAMGSDYRPPKDLEFKDLMRQTLRELLRHGNNLNQIARHLNAHIATPDQAANAVEAIRPDYIRTLKTVRSTLAEGMEEPAP